MLALRHAGAEAKGGNQRVEEVEKRDFPSHSGVSRCGLAVRRLAGKQKDLGSIRFGSPFSSFQKNVVHGHCPVTLRTQLMKHKNGSHNCPP